MTSLLRTGTSLALCACLLVACGPKRRHVDAAPEWRTEEGAQELRYEVIEALLEGNATAEAMVLIRTMRTEGADDPVLDLYQARALHQDGLPSEAERLLLRYHDKRPRDPRALRALGIVYADTQRTEQAITAFTDALKLDDEDPPTWNNLGFLYLAASRFPEAEDALSTAVELDGTEPRYRNNLGFALAGNGKTVAAFEAFRSVGTAADAHFNVGLSFEMRGDADSARHRYDKVLGLQPQHAGALEAIDRLDAAAADAPVQDP